MAITRVYHALGEVIAVGGDALRAQLPGGAFASIPAEASVLPPGVILSPDGGLIRSSAPSASDRRLFLSPAGGWVASTTQPPGYRPLSREPDRWVAGPAS